jgi:alkanesulfonate monooxygenase SsuD/methylene tetrahydromethanopterin reductase-like flavin-dependent oxidoreductase (luciferase family)
MAEEYAKRDFGFYGDLPSYRAMLEREGLTNSWDIALSGSFEQVAEGLQRYENSGGTQVVAAVYGPDEARQQTISELAQLIT